MDGKRVGTSRRLEVDVHAAVEARNVITVDLPPSGTVASQCPTAVLRARPQRHTRTTRVPAVVDRDFVVHGPRPVGLDGGGMSLEMPAPPRRSNENDLEPVARIQ